MAKFVTFADALVNVEGPADQNVFIDPEHVRVVRADYVFGGGTIIQLEGQEISVREDVDTVMKALS